LVIDKKRNILWFDSKNNGLIAFDVNARTYRHFTKSDGLTDNNIAALLLVGNNLWIAGYSGLACMNLRNYEITAFGKEDGFPDMPINNGANLFYDSSTAQLYVPFFKAVVRFSPERLLRKKSPPDVFIEELNISDKRSVFLPSDHIVTSWKETGVRLTIGAINFSDAESQRFAYRIVRDEAGPWIPLEAQPTFSISNLPPGTHTIQTKVYSANNRWAGQIKEFTLVVTPPFWRETWFLVLAGILAVLLVYFLVRWRTNIARKKEMVKTQIEKLKADDYKAQFELEQISNYFSSSLAGLKEEDEVLWDVARNLIGKMNYEDCIIYMWNNDKTRMVQKAAYGPKGAPEVISQNLFQVAPGQGIVGEVIQTRAPILVNDTRHDSRYRVDDEFRLSEVSVPILHNGELLGVIDSENSKANYYSERDIKILTTIATLLGNKLTQLQSEQELEAKHQELVGINEQLAEARLSALQAQMNPHFVFNALNSIKRMILDGDNEKASRYLSKFALMIRMTLEHSKQVFVTLEENIKYIKAYLEMEKLRFDDTFTYNICADENVDTSDVVVPSMMIQPLVENAIWHGLMQSQKDKKIFIAFCEDDDMLKCIVEDNGIGIRHSEELKEKQRPLHRSEGLDNLQKRIKIINGKYDTACSLQITDLKQAGFNGSGTRVVLQLRLMTIDKNEKNESHISG
ncbi:MAG TPA: histidine kinase, partial [Chitinophagaceae bacterium]